MATSTILNYEEMTFIIDLKKPLGMAITHQEDTHYHAVITAINPDQQANAAGVQIGMHIHSINGRKCLDRSLEWVIGLVKKAKSNVERNDSMEMICAKETAPEEVEEEVEEVEEEAEEKEIEVEGNEVKFVIDLTKPLDMAITHPEDDSSHYPAVITKLKPDGQAELAGVEVGMHIHYINGITCKDMALKDVLVLVSNAKKKASSSNVATTMSMICAKEAEEVHEEEEEEEEEAGGGQQFSQTEITFEIDLTKPLAMAITHPEEDHSHYPAVITQIQPNGQAATAGIEIGMHIHQINGIDCKDKELEWVINLIQNAKKEASCRDKDGGIDLSKVFMTMICAKTVLSKMKNQKEQEKIENKITTEATVEATTVKKDTVSVTKKESNRADTFTSRSITDLDPDDDENGNGDEVSGNRNIDVFESVNLNKQQNLFKASQQSIKPTLQQQNHDNTDPDNVTLSTASLAEIDSIQQQKVIDLKKRTIELEEIIRKQKEEMASIKQTKTLPLEPTITMEPIKPSKPLTPMLDPRPKTKQIHTKPKPPAKQQNNKTTASNTAASSSPSPLVQHRTVRKQRRPPKST